MLAPTSRAASLAAALLAASTAAAQPVDPADVLASARAAYQSAPGVKDSVSYRVVLPGAGVDTGDFDFALGANQDLHLDVSPMHAYAVGDTLYLTFAGADVYFQTPIEGGVYATLASIMRDTTPPPLPQAMFRWGAPDAQLLPSFGFGLVAPDHIESATTIAGDNGPEAHELTLRGEGGVVKARFDAESGFLTSMTVEATPPGAPPEAKIIADADFSPRAVATAAEAVAFDPGDRERIYTLTALMGQVVSPGDPAPDLALTTPDGDSIALADLQGKVVVLEFWSSWCALCRVSLPAAERFASELDADAPVAVYAVNTLETRDANWRSRADQSWATMGADLPVLYDLDDALASAFGIDSLPITVVIGPDGVVAAVHARDTKDLTQALRESVAAAMPD